MLYWFFQILERDHTVFVDVEIVKGFEKLRFDSLLEPAPLLDVIKFKKLDKIQRTRFISIYFFDHFLQLCFCEILLKT